MNEQIEQIYRDDPTPEHAFQSAYKQLRPVERAFVDAYISDLQSSAVAAGQKVVDFLNSSGRGTVKRPHWHANQMMQKPLVRAAISERVLELTEAMEINAYKVLKEVANIAMSSIAHYMEVDPNTGVPTFTLGNCTPEQLAAVQSIELEYDRETGMAKKFKFKLHDKLGALEKLMQYMKLYERDITPGTIQGTPGMQPAQIAATTTTAQAADMYQRTLRRAQT